MPKVTLGLTDQDVANFGQIRNVVPNARSNAHAISIALSLARFLIDSLRKPDTQLLLRNGDQFERIVMPELENLLAREAVDIEQPAATEAEQPAAAEAKSFVPAFRG